MKVSAPPRAVISRRPADGDRGISVVIPLWRDVGALTVLMPILRAAAEVREVIVSLAEGDTALCREVEDAGAICVDAGAPSRGRQLDSGAAVARGNWLLFHHADSQLTAAHLRALASLEADAAAVGGAFYRRFDERHPALRRFEAIERWHNRSFGALYGDQSIFTRREVFEMLGGFRGLPLMEDVDFSLRLRRAGKVVLLDPPMASSPRRHLARGPWRTTAFNATLLALFRLGVPAHRLHAWYYRPPTGGLNPRAQAERPTTPQPAATPNPATLIR